MVNIIKSKTSRHSIISLGTTIINGILGLLFYIALARLLGPTEFGNILLVITLIIVCSDIADFGVNSGVVNFVSKHRGEDKSYSYLISALLSKIVVGGIVSISIFLLAGLIANLFFQKNDLAGLFMIGSGGILGMMLFSFSTSALQAMQKYGSWSVLLIGSNLLRIAAIFSLLATNSLSVETAMISYILMPYLFFVLSFFYLPVRKILTAKEIKQTAKSLFSFSSWVGGSNILWVLLTKSDTFLLGRLVTSFQLGIYGLATQLTIAVPQLISAFAAVLAPRFAAFSDKREMNLFLRKFTFIISGLILLMLICLPLVWYLIPFVLGNSYLDSYPVFVILLLGASLLLLATPMHEAIRYYFQKPHLFLGIYGIQLILLVVLGLDLTPKLGIMGMSYAVLIANLVNLLLSAYFYVRLLRK